MRKLKWNLFCLFAFSLVTTLIAQKDLKAYQIFDRNGKKVSFDEMANSLIENDVIFFGELHNNPIAHWLQFELAKELALKRNNEIIFGAEMFEKDNQLILDEYLAGLIPEKVLIKDGKAWDNYKTDYAPLLNFAKDKKLPFIATNAPRRYASLVSKKGLLALENLSKNVRKNYLAPLEIEVPYENSSYKAMVAMMGGHGMKGTSKYFVQAQALKDATMGYTITRALRKKNKKKLFLHFNGNYHSKNHESTVWYVNHYNDKLMVAVISFVEQSDVSELEEKNKGTNEFTIVSTKNMTKTF